MQNEVPKFEDTEGLKAWAQKLSIGADWTDKGHILELVQAIPVEAVVLGRYYEGQGHAQDSFNTLIEAVDALAHNRDSLMAMEHVDQAIENIPQDGTDMLNFAINRFRRGYENTMNTLNSAPEYNM